MSLLERLLLVVPLLFAAGLIASATGQNSPHAPGDVTILSSTEVNTPPTTREMTAAASADVTGPLSFVGVTPCRIVETRPGYNFSGQAGPPALIANQQRTFQITGTVPGLPQQCGIPSTAVAISVNFTVTGFSSGGDLRIFPAGSPTPLASIINFKQENVANATNMPLGPVSGTTEKGFTVQADGASTDFIADVNGYFVPRHFTTLESGQAEKGVYSIYYTATAANQFGIAAISFPVPISWSGEFAFSFVLPGGPPTSYCPGDYNNPQAKPGCLCVYEATAANVAGRGWASLQDGSPLSGVGYQVHSSGAGVTYSRGSWAATAP